MVRGKPRYFRSQRSSSAAAALLAAPVCFRPPFQKYHVAMYLGLQDRPADCVRFLLEDCKLKEIKQYKSGEKSMLPLIPIAVLLLPDLIRLIEGDKTNNLATRAAGAVRQPSAPRTRHRLARNWPIRPWPRNLRRALSRSRWRLRRRGLRPRMIGASPTSPNYRRASPIPRPHGHR